MEMCSQVHNQLDVEEIYFLISSGGGDVNAAVSLYHFLRALPHKIIMHNIGAIESAANVVFMAGAERYATKDSSFLFHGVQYSFGDSVIGKDKIEEGLTVVKEAENKIVSILSANSSLKEPEVRTLFTQGESRPASYALEKKVVSSLCDVSIASDAPVYTINSSSSS